MAPRSSCAACPPRFGIAAVLYVELSLVSAQDVLGKGSKCVTDFVILLHVFALSRVDAAAWPRVCFKASMSMPNSPFVAGSMRATQHADRSRSHGDRPSPGAGHVLLRQYSKHVIRGLIRTPACRFSPRTHSVLICKETYVACADQDAGRRSRRRTRSRRGRAHSRERRRRRTPAGEAQLPTRDLCV